MALLFLYLPSSSIMLARIVSQQMPTASPTGNFNSHLLPTSMSPLVTPGTQVDLSSPDGPRVVPQQVVQQQQQQQPLQLPQQPAATITTTNNAVATTLPTMQPGTMMQPQMMMQQLPNPQQVQQFQQLQQLQQLQQNPQQQFMDAGSSSGNGHRRKRVSLNKWVLYIVVGIASFLASILFLAWWQPAIVRQSLTQPPATKKSGNSGSTTTKPPTTVASGNDQGEQWLRPPLSVGKLILAATGTACVALLLTFLLTLRHSR